MSLAKAMPEAVSTAAVASAAPKAAVRIRISVLFYGRGHAAPKLAAEFKVILGWSRLHFYRRVDELPVAALFSEYQQFRQRL